MGMKLVFQNQQIFRQFILPAVNNADFYYTLSGNRFWLEEDLELHFEIIAGKWRIWPSAGCRIFDLSEGSEGRLMDPVSLTDGKAFLLQTSNGEELSLKVLETERNLIPYARYLISGKEMIRIGSAESCEIRFLTGSFSGEVSAVLEREGENLYLSGHAEDAVYLNGIILRGRSCLSFGDRIDLSGLEFVYLDPVLAIEKTDSVEVRLQQIPEVPAGVSASSERIERPEEELFHRAPRKMEPVHSETITIEQPPEKNRMKKASVLQMMGNSVLMVIPMLVGCLMMIIASRVSGGNMSLFMYSGIAMAAASAIVGIIWGLGNIASQKRELKIAEAQRFDVYCRYLVRKTDEIRKLYKENKDIMYRMHPSASECLNYDGQGSELWNRNSAQADFLHVRTGIGDIPFQVEVKISEESFSLYEDDLRRKPSLIKTQYETLFEVPFLLNLKQTFLLGLIGGEGKFGAFELMRMLVLQLAATHSYTDLKMVFLFDDRTESEEFGFAKWLPHVWSEDRKMRYIGGNPTEIRDVCHELHKIFTKRAEETSDREKQEGLLPHFVIFLSNPRLIEGEMLSGDIYKTASSVGLSTVILTEFRENLPNACSYYLENDETFCGAVRPGKQSPILFDHVSAEELETFSRRISGVRVRETGISGDVPSRVTFMEMYGKTRIEDLDIRERWLKNRIYDNVRGLLGLKGGDVPVYLDLHEKYHGPHGLVAGTTGSGKSETLQTYMLSLAVEYSPDDVSFFIIDYKGGGMANLFDGLPHMAGSISNLSGAQVQRALVSIKAENRRRQRMFNRAGVNNINKYTQLYKAGEVKTPIPHLFLIVDEFAELKREEPDFMRELISVAQVGRSLGVHLILSTQKPSGTVDDNIWSNSKFRICLRVQTKEDSMDMLGRPDAAFITDAGRGYLQVGHNELYELFQSGYSGAVYDPENAEYGKEATCLLTVSGQVDIRYKKTRQRETNRKEINQLDAIKAYLARIAREDGYQNTHQMWMPVLRNPLYLEDLDEYKEKAADEGGWKVTEEEMRKKWDLSAIIGQTDDPGNQEQLPLKVSFSEGGNHAVLGSVLCGKSTMLQTILYALANKYSPRYLNIYALDYSSRMLSPFEDLAHVGGIMYEGDTEKTERFFRMMETILNERKVKYRGGNYGQYVRANGASDPAILLVVDNFSAFNERTDGKYLPFLITLSREGVSNGIYLLLSAGGYGLSEIPGRLAENMGTALPLALPDKYAYGDILHAMRVEFTPDSQFRGRGLCLFDGKILEYQTALACPAEDDYQRIEIIRRRCEKLNQFWEGPSARQVPEIPEHPVWDEFRNLPEVRDLLEDHRYLPIGYRSDDAQIYSVDLYQTYCYLIAGGRRSGKTTLIREMVLAALQKPNEGVVLIDPDSGLKDLYLEDALVTITNPEELYEFCIDKLTPLFSERNVKKNNLVEQGLERDEFYRAMDDEKPVFLFISDLVWFIQTVYKDEHDMKGFMETIFRKGEDHKIYFIGVLPLEEKAQAAGFEAFNQFVRYGTGIQLGGNTAQNPYLSFEYLSYSDQIKPELPGIGLIPDTDGRKQGNRVVLPYTAKRKRKTAAGEDR